jgi:hypothetical protein
MAKNIKLFRRSIRMEIAMIADVIKRLEFAASRIRGTRRERQLKGRLLAVKRMKDSLTYRLLRLRPVQGKLCPVALQNLSDEVRRARYNCQLLEAEMR